MNAPGRTSDFLGIISIIAVVLVIIVSAVTCKEKPDTGNPVAKDSLVINDTIYVPNGDTIRLTINTIDSFRNVIRSKDSALFEANFRLARVWYYDSLCLKNSKLEIYLTGWVRRALEK